MQQYAKVVWTAEDVLSLTEDPDNDFQPTITVAQAEEFLARNERHIQDRLVEMGWTVIETLMLTDGLL